MRITGGAWVGRRVHAVPQSARPPMDRMRESMFAILGDIAGCRVLDLFGGSGILTLEALSRGAGAATVVERDRGAAASLRRNLGMAAQPPRIYILPVERYLRRAREPFDLIFLDPPFAYPDKTSLVRLVAGLVAPAGRVLIHYPSAEALPERIAGQRRFGRRRYGGSTVGFYRLEEMASG